MTGKKATEAPKAAPGSVDIASLQAITAAPVGIQVVKAGEPTPDASDLPVKDMPAYARDIKDPSDHTNIADRIDYLCAKVGGSYSRKPLDNNQVQLALKLADGTVLAGVGLTTAEAFNQLLDKTTRFLSAGATAGV